MIATYGQPEQRVQVQFPFLPVAGSERIVSVLNRKLFRFPFPFCSVCVCVCQAFYCYRTANVNVPLFMSEISCVAATGWKTGMLMKRNSHRIQRDCPCRSSPISSTTRWDFYIYSSCKWKQEYEGTETSNENKNYKEEG